MPYLLARVAAWVLFIGGLIVAITGVFFVFTFNQPQLWTLPAQIAVAALIPIGLVMTANGEALQATLDTADKFDRLIFDVRFQGKLIERATNALETIVTKLAEAETPK